MAPDFLAILTLSAALDIAIALGVLLRPGGRIGVARCAGAAVATGAAGLGKMALLASVFDLGPFAWVALAYVGGVVAVPLVGLVVLAAGARRCGDGRRRASGPVLVGAACALWAGPVGIWASFVEPRWVEFSRVDVPVPPARGGFGAVRIVVLADVQTARIGGYEMSVAERVNALEPDIVIVPGDLFQRHYGLWSKPAPRLDEVRADFVRFLASLEAPGGVYFVPGNTELYYDWRSMVRDAGVIDLANRVERVSIQREGVDRDVVIAGTEWVYDSAAAGGIRTSLEALGDDGPIVVYATHTPDGFMLLEDESRVDLAIAGHTHGGQVRVPGWGAPITMARLAPRAVGSGGLHRVNGNEVYVSRGVGRERGHAPPLRLFCRPEVTVLEIGG